jgi:hypothetical protein
MMHGAKPFEHDVNVTILDDQGRAHNAIGILTDLGSTCDGFSLDHEAEEEYVLGLPQASLKILRYGGSISFIRAWFSTVDGQQIVFEKALAERVIVSQDETVEFVGPSCGYFGEV